MTERTARSSDDPTIRPALPTGSATMDDFSRLDLRVARVVDASPLKGARRPAYLIILDLGPLGRRRSTAQLPATYPDPAALIDRLVIVVANFPPRLVAGEKSEVLVLGALPLSGLIPVLSVDEGAMPGDPIG